MKPVPPPRRPLLSQASRPLTVTIPAVNEAGETVPTAIAGEYPLTLYVDRREIVTLMTLGAAPEALAIGWLRNQRLVESLDEIAAVQVDWEVEAAAVTTSTCARSRRPVPRSPAACSASTAPGSSSPTTSPSPSHPATRGGA